MYRRILAFDSNGTLLHHTTTDELYLPFGHVDPRLVEALEAAGVPLERGQAIVSTQATYAETVWHVLNKWGGDAAVVRNRGVVRVLPPGAAKGAGLERLMGLCGLSPRNLVSFGDGESDLSLLQVAEIKVAVANAVGNLKAMADYVTPEAGPAGVTYFIERYLLDGMAFDFPVRGAHHFALGTTGEIRLNAHDLVARHVLIAGGSGYSKSWLASRLADGLIDSGYQLLGLDPVGDLRALARHATCLCLGRKEILPTSLVVQLLAETDLSLVLDLSHVPTREEQVLHTTALLRHMLEVHRRLGKPHWLVIDEAQDLLGGPDNPARLPLLQAPTAPGMCLVAWQPSRLDKAVLGLADGFLLTRHRLSREGECLADLLANRGLDVAELGEHLGKLGEGQALMWGLTSPPGDSLIRLRFSVGPRTFPKMRRLHLYLEDKVAPAKRFYFHDEMGFTAPAGNLSELIDRMRTVTPDVIDLHFQRADFSRWIRDVLHDDTLARWIERLRTTELSDEASSFFFTRARSG